MLIDYLNFPWKMVTIFQYFTHKSQLTRIKQSCELFPPESQNVNISTQKKSFEFQNFPSQIYSSSKHWIFTKIRVVRSAPLTHCVQCRFGANPVLKQNYLACNIRRSCMQVHKHTIKRCQTVDFVAIQTQRRR